MKTRAAMLLAISVSVGTGPLVAAPLQSGAGRKDRYGDPLPAGALVRMGTVRMRHGEAQLAFSADGKALISAGNDRTVRFWSLTNGEQLRRTTIPLPPERAEPRRVELRRLAPDGGTLVVTSHDVLTLWDTTTGNQLVGITPGKGTLRRLAVSEDARMVAVLYPDCRSVGVWRTAPKSERVVHALERHVEEIALAPDGKSLAAVGGEPAIRVWQLPSGKELLRLAIPPDVYLRTPSLAFSPDGNRLALGNWDGNVLTWDVARGKLLGHFEPDTPEDGVRVAFSPDGKRLATGGERTVRILDIDTGKVVHEIAGMGDGWLVFSPDGQTLAGSGGATACEIGLWDVATGKARFTWDGHPGEVRYLAVSPDGKALVSHAPVGTAVPRVWEAATGKPLRGLGKATDASFFLDFYSVRAKGWPDAVVAAGGRNGVVLWDPNSGRELGRFPPEPPKALEPRPSFRVAHLSADGSRLLTLDDSGALTRNEGALFRWDTDPVRLSGRAETSGVDPASISRDGREVLGERNGKVVLHDIKTGKNRVTLPTGLTLPGVFAPDGRFLAVLGTTEPVGAATMARLGQPDAVCLVERETGKVFLRLETGHASPCAVSATGGSWRRPSRTRCASGRSPAANSSSLSAAREHTSRHRHPRSCAVSRSCPTAEGWRRG